LLGVLSLVVRCWCLVLGVESENLCFLFGR
jgi:hypothetical protein